MVTHLEVVLVYLYRVDGGGGRISIGGLLRFHCIRFGLSDWFFLQYSDQDVKLGRLESDMSKIS